MHDLALIVDVAESSSFRESFLKFEREKTKELELEIELFEKKSKRCQLEYQFAQQEEKNQEEVDAAEKAYTESLIFLQLAKLRLLHHAVTSTDFWGTVEWYCNQMREDLEKRYTDPENN